MRLDRYLTEMGVCSRSEGSKRIRRGDVTVDGNLCKDPSFHIEPGKQTVLFNGQEISYLPFRYIMMNKPEGVVSATEDGKKTVLDLLPDDLRKFNLFPCGRLDKNTVGFVLLTDNGTLAHILLAPKSHVEKVYRFETERPYTDEDISKLEGGILLDGYRTKPCKVRRLSETFGEITLSEGKYHQIKRMFSALCNKIVFLERISFAGIPLDASLERGKWRFLTDCEVSSLEKFANSQKF
jgi:16S rRNA pseudouridine516 synthase